MKMSRDFCSGYASAIHSLGQEGDSRHVDWSGAYEYLKERLNTFEPIGENITERLRYRGGLCTEAADEIDRLRAALQRIADRDVDDDLRERPDVLAGIAYAALEAAISR